MNCAVVVWSLPTHSEPQLLVIMAGNMIITLALLTSIKEPGTVSPWWRKVQLSGHTERKECFLA